MDRGVVATSDRRAMETPAARESTPAYQDSAREADREPATAGITVDRSRSAPYQPRATFGQRVRAFFSGREPAGY
jgi:hypothetical protein